jgi:exopolyphosphatase/guanosine-5'-triphosphate,3'-diphosphate pyrophosphatase
MRIGIIDLGTNSVRFDVHQLGPGRKVRLLHREKLMVRLGQGAFLSGKLDRAAAERSLQAFRRFSRLASQLGTTKVIAFGTSALREVQDRERFLEKIREASGIEVRVISGAEEARLIALGILRREKKLKGKSKGRTALVDIGGGSTEISICRGKEVLFSQSFPLGTARLQQLFLKKSPPAPETLDEMRKLIRSTLLQETLASRWPKVARIVGSSGTIRALARILAAGEPSDSIDRGELEDLNDLMSKMTTSELLGIEGMEPRRVDMILAGSVLFEECMQVLGAKKAVTTEISLRDGILEEELQLFQQGESSHLSLHIPDLVQKACAFGGDAEHVARVAGLAEVLYTRLQRLHGLPAEWKVYLLAAVILRDVGEQVSLSGHEKHSSYIIRHTDLPAMQDWELELIAALVEQHEGTKIEPKALERWKSKPRRQAFLRLLAMLRLVDALDSGPDVKVSLRKLSVQRGHVELRLGGSGLTGLEVMNAEQKAPLFERAFGRELQVR